MADGSEAGSWGVAVGKAGNFGYWGSLECMQGWVDPIDGRYGDWECEDAIDPAWLKDSGFVLFAVLINRVLLALLFGLFRAALLLSHSNIAHVAFSGFQSLFFA